MQGSEARVIELPSARPAPGTRAPQAPPPPAAGPNLAALAIGFLGGAAMVLAALAVPGTWMATLFSLGGLGVIGAAGWWLAFRPLQRAATGDPTQTLLARVSAASPEGRLIVGPAGEVVYANPAYLRLADTPPGAPPPALAELYAGDEAARDRLARMERAARSGSEERDELGLVDREGRRRWLKLEVHPLADMPGHLVWYVADATLAHEMREAIREEQAKLADFIDNAPVGFYSIDDGGRFLFVNHTLASWLGTTPEALTGEGHRLTDVLADAGTATALLPRAGGAAPADREAQLRGRDGQVRTVRITQSVVADGSGRLRTRSVARDLTQELEWRKALRQAEMHFRRFFDHAPVGIVVVTAEGAIVESNTAFQRFAGAEAGARLVDLVAAEDRVDLAARLQAALTGEDPAGPLEVRFKGPRARVAQLFASRLGEADNEADERRLLLHLIDTTDQKSLELQFAQSQKMQAVGQLAGGVAHDFNNLLTAMIGFCDLLLLRHQPGDQSFADVMQVKQNANRAANLVRQLLAFSRKQTLRPKVLDITDVLAELRNLLGRLLGETVELKMVHGRDLWPVKVDQGQFEQVVINLAVNARDAMAGGGTLTIRTRNLTRQDSTRYTYEVMPPGEYVLIEVSDTGRGIPKENLGKIFEPFFTTKEVGAGTGLGLSTVYGIIKQTGGFIFPESEIGKGANFLIFLPRYQPTAAEETVAREDSARPSSRDLTGKGTVLLVEDEDAVRVFAARALRNKGYTVIEAASGDRALELVADDAKGVDLLVSDVVMPNMDGPTLARKIRERRPELKIIFISGYAEDAFKKHPGGPQDVAFLPKPFSLSQLAGKVKEVLAERR